MEVADSGRRPRRRAAALFAGVHHVEVGAPDLARFRLARGRGAGVEGGPGDRHLDRVALVLGAVVHGPVEVDATLDVRVPVRVTDGARVAAGVVAGVEDDVPRRDLDLEVVPTVAARVEHDLDRVLLPEVVVPLGELALQVVVVDDEADVEVLVVPEELRGDAEARRGAVHGVHERGGGLCAAPLGLLELAIDGDVAGPVHVDRRNVGRGRRLLAGGRLRRRDGQAARAVLPVARSAGDAEAMGAVPQADVDRGALVRPLRGQGDRLLVLDGLSGLPGARLIELAHHALHVGVDPVRARGVGHVGEELPALLERALHFPVPGDGQLLPGAPGLAAEVVADELDLVLELDVELVLRIGLVFGDVGVEALPLGAGEVAGFLDAAGDRRGADEGEDEGKEERLGDRHRSTSVASSFSSS